MPCVSVLCRPSAPIAGLGAAILVLSMAVVPAASAAGAAEGVQEQNLRTLQRTIGNATERQARERLKEAAGEDEAPDTAAGDTQGMAGGQVAEDRDDRLPDAGESSVAAPVDDPEKH